MADEERTADSITYRLPETDGAVIRAAVKRAVHRGVAANISDFHRRVMMRAALQVLAGESIEQEESGVPA